MEFYTHTDSEHFVTQDYYIKDWGDTKPLVSWNFESWAGSWFYGFGQFSIGASPYSGQGVSGYATPGTSFANASNIQVTIDEKYTGFVSSTLYGQASWGTNTFFAQLPATNLDFNFPERAVFAVGGDNFSITVGRDKPSWGAGESGNLMVGSRAW